MRAPLLIAFWFVTVFLSGARAAEIEPFNLPGDVEFVLVKGEITRGDLDRFRVATIGREKVTVVLQSPGGLVNEALKIGSEIRLRNYATLVDRSGSCFSACGLIWLSGARRYMSPESLIGFHAAYRKEAGEFRESGVANAEIGSFLSHLGLRVEAIKFFTIAGPTNLELLTPVKARALGIEIFLLEGEKVVTPHDAPTGDRYAERWVLYNILRSQCGPYLTPDAQAIGQGQEDAFKRGNEILQGEQWVKLWTQMLDDWGAQIKPKGLVGVCLEAEQMLRSQGLSTGVSGPSFECGGRLTPTETTLCSDAGLWAKDRAMNAIYLWVRANATPAIRKPMLEIQRAWMAARNGCVTDVGCLNDVYDQRLQELKGIRIQ